MQASLRGNIFVACSKWNERRGEIGTLCGPPHTPFCEKARAALEGDKRERTVHGWTVVQIYEIFDVTHVS